jgi:hypothetical protein
MRIFFLTVLLLSSFAFGQNEFFDKFFHIPSKLQDKELRVYISQDGTLNDRSAFILKQTKEKWKGKFYLEEGRGKFTVRKFKLKNGDKFWSILMNNIPKVDTSFSDYSLHPTFYEVHITNNTPTKAYNFLDATNCENINNETMKSVFVFFSLLERRFRIKL